MNFELKIGKTEITQNVNPPNTQPVSTSIKNCLQAAQFFSEELAEGNVNSFFSNIHHNFNLRDLPFDIKVIKKSSSGIVAGLEIDFFEDILVTYFKDEKKSISLACALGIIHDLTEIFAKIERSAKSTGVAKLTSTTEVAELTSIEDEFSHALDTTDHPTSDVKISIDGKEVLELYPSIGKTVFTTSKGQSSIPLKMVQNCAHLFNKEFAQAICPLLGLESNSKILRAGVNQLYLGRCILGLGKRLYMSNIGKVVFERELSRIVTHVTNSGYEFYTKPLA